MQNIKQKVNRCKRNQLNNHKTYHRKKKKQSTLFETEGEPN